MRIGIITFYFAHNYGAMLQAFALKNYLEMTGHEVQIVPYYPRHFQRQYAISPFVNGITIKQRVRNLLFYFKCAPQAKLFNNFKLDYFLRGNNKIEICDIEDLQKYCEDFDIIVYGSDQIWNKRITEADIVYWGGNIDKRKVAYAASMGNCDYIEIDNENIKRHLNLFQAISVREPNAQKHIQECVSKKIDIVCDPVFLLSKEEWRKHETEINIRKPYILLYMLDDDENLLELACKYAKKQNLGIFEIHPTLALSHDKIKQLKKVGPKEFLFLIEHAEYICTNSFHAIAFSVIYGKKIIHIPNSKSPERTVALLNHIGIKSGKNNEYIVDFADVDYLYLDTFISSSKSYIAKNI